MAARRRNASPARARRAGPAAVEAEPLPWTTAAPRPPDPILPEEPVGRPWSMAAALEPVPPLAPPRPAPAPRAPGGGDERREGHSWALTAVVAVALAVALAVLALSRLHLGSTASPGLVLNGLAAAPDSAVPVGLPLGHFPASATHVEVGCDYAGASPGDVVNFRITLQPGNPGVSTVPPPDQSHTFTAADGPTGHITVSISPAHGGFVPGVYTVDARHAGRTLRTTQFTVESPPAVASPSPARP